MLRFHNRLCTGCHLCELACSSSHLGEFAPTRARIRAQVRPQAGDCRVMACFSCPKAPCIDACPQQAISRTEPGRPLVVDPDRCDGCRACLPACPYGAMYFDEATSYALASDLCGGDPQCVQFCYPQAVTFEEQGR